MVYVLQRDLNMSIYEYGLPTWLSGKESICQAGGTDFRFLAQEGHLEKQMATHYSFLPGLSSEQGALAGYSPCSHKETQLSN